MANKTTKITTGVTILAMAIAVPFIRQHEGEKLTAYQDVVGVYTICSGIAYVPKGTVYSKEQCAKLTATEIGKHMDQVSALLKVPVPPRTLAAHASFHYNIGDAAYRRSTTLRLTNEGNIAGGCSAMGLWYGAGGKDCRIKKSGCFGVWNRRKDEIALCLSGVQTEISK